MEGSDTMGVYYSDSIKDAYNPTVTSSTTRYKTKTRLVNDKKETVIRFIRSRDITFSDDNSTVHVVSPVEAYRPDLIAYKYFGDEKYAWVILAANNLKLSYQLVPNLKIIIPSIASLQGYNGKLVTR